MKHTKIAIIGAGSVGSTTAYALMLRNIAAEIVLIDINKQRCKGEVFDLSDALSFSGTSKICNTPLSEVDAPDIIIIAAGQAQKPGQNRTELVSTNKKIVTSIIKDLKPLKKETIIIMVTNPVDAMTYHAQQISGLPKAQVFGTGTFLDTQRLRGELSEKLSIAQQSIHTYVLGEHGDSQFVAWSSARIAGVPILDFHGITQKDLDQFAKRAREKVYEIIECKGATFFGIAACTAALCENIIFNQKRIAPISVFIERFDVCLSMPAVIGCEGVEKIISIPLSDLENKQLEQSAQKIRETIDMA